MRLLITTLSVYLIVLLVGCDELKKSEEEIRRDILNAAPLGSAMEDVISILERNKYKIAWINYEQGFNDHRLRPPKIVGKKSVRAELGEYRGILFLKTSVTVFFAFDNNKKLIDLRVHKTTDAP